MNFNPPSLASLVSCVGLIGFNQAMLIKITSQFIKL